MPDPATIPGIIDATIAEATAWGASHLEVVLLRHGQPLPEEERQAGEAAAAFVADGRWESFLRPDPAFRLRVRRAMGEIAAARMTGTVAVACHSGVINAHLADTLALDRDYFVVLSTRHSPAYACRPGAGGCRASTRPPTCARTC
jgi:hypothetical protein